MLENIRIMLVDDHRIVRQGLHAFFELYDDFRVVSEVSNGEEALQQIEVCLPDVVVMDLLMPGGIDGVETTRCIRLLTPHTQVVVLTSHSDDSQVVAALRAGAIGYVRKDADPAILISSVRAAVRGQSVLDPVVATVVLQEMIRSEGEKTVFSLTEREQVVLRKLALGHTNKQIAEELFVSGETVKTHVGNILAKLHLTHRTQAVIYALKSGLIALDDIELS